MRYKKRSPGKDTSMQRKPLPTSGSDLASGSGEAIVGGRRHKLPAGTLMLIERGAR